MAKNRMIQEDDQGWSFSDQFVCAACVADSALKAVVQAEVSDDDVCDFCSSSPAASLDVLLEAFVVGLNLEYENAANGVSYDSKEGGYQFLGGHWDTWDLVTDHADAFESPELADAVRGHLPDQTWVERDFAWRRRDAVLADAWAQFREAVMFRTRYVIWLSDPKVDEQASQEGEVPPAKVLAHVGELLDVLGIVRLVGVNEQWWRAQSHSDRRIPATAARLGTSPRPFAKQGNRMNPAGIPMFYGASTAVTAVKEVLRHAASKKQRITYGLFKLEKPVHVVDFTRLPDEPSLFDPDLGQWRREIRFLHQFVRDMSLPIDADEEHVEYVPTQVLTEYLLRVHGGRDGRPDIHGLIYRSSQTGEDAIVLDLDNAHCVDGAAPVATDGVPQLTLDTATVRRLSRRRVRRRARGHR